MKKITYGEAIRDGFAYTLKNYPEVFVIGQGLWSPWYVGSSMTKLEEEFGKSRIIDTPVSEMACTSAALGASLYGKKAVVVHPRIDFMILASDSIVNQAAKWSHMLGGQSNPSLTIRGIINRGGEQGAQHSQSLQSWYAHIPGLRVVMPYTVEDARDLLISSILSKDPVLYIDDRWLYSQEEYIPEPVEYNLNDLENKKILEGSDITIASNSWGTKLAIDAAEELLKKNISAEVIDLRILNPLNVNNVIKSVKKTGRLLSIDISWKTCGIGGEVIARVFENVNPHIWKSSPSRISLPDTPAPSSSFLEKNYYPSVKEVIKAVKKQIKI